MKETSTNCISEKEKGLGGTFKWSIGGLFHNTSMWFIFHAASQPDKDFVTKWTSAMGYKITRVTTIAVVLADVSGPEGMARVLSAFDAQAAAVVLARMETFKADNNWDPNLLR